MLRWMRRRKPPVPSRNNTAGTVGLDHVSARGVAPSGPARRSITFDFGDTKWFADDWQMWRNHMRDNYKLGVSRYKVIEVAKPRDALLRFEYDVDYDQVRSMMADAGMRVSPFDTITPEDITNG